MKKQSTTWEPIMFRPALTPHWKCMEQRWSTRSGEITFARQGKIHHLAEDRSFWIVFNEFNPSHYANQTNTYTYSVHGGNDIQPNRNLRFFSKLKDAENYMMYLAESTDKWLAEIVSEKAVIAYDKKIEELRKLTRKKHEHY